MGEHAARLPSGPADDAQWYRDTFRTLCLDFHYPEWVTDLGAALDEHTALAQMEELAAIGVEAVHVVAKDRYGHALYPTDVPGGERHPHLAGDYLGTTVRAAQRVGLRTVVSCNVGASETLRARQPDWRMRLLDGADGSPTDGPLCLLSPYRSEVVLPQLTEIARTYAVDGFWLDGLGWQLSRWCGCRWCQAAFGQATGHDAIPAPDEPHADSYRQWRAETQEQIAAEITGRLHAIEPSLIVSPPARCPAVTASQRPAGGRTVARPIRRQPIWRRWRVAAVRPAGGKLRRPPTHGAAAAYRCRRCSRAGRWRLLVTALDSGAQYGLCDGIGRWRAQPARRAAVSRRAARAVRYRGARRHLRVHHRARGLVP